MQTVALQAAKRTPEFSPKALRRAGKVPGVVYGNTENTMFTVEENALRKAYIKAGESTLVELDIDGSKIPVLFQSIDQDPVSDRPIHVDFYAVDMKKEVETDVQIRFEGEAPAIKEHGAILVTALHSVKVKCLPANLPHDLPIDLGKLIEFGATLTVADIDVPTGVTIVNDLTDVIAIAQEPREEEVVEVAAPVEGAEGAPAAEGAEGAPAAEGAPSAEGAGAPAAKKKE
jgi:large subunit ribosomal protein L25